LERIGNPLKEAVTSKVGLSIEMLHKPATSILNSPPFFGSVGEATHLPVL
jgi:hypothetical protein